MQRRTLLQAAATVAQVSLALSIGLLPKRVLATWPADAFHSENLSDAERLLFEGREIADSDRITMDAPDIAENGRNVPVEVTTDLPGLQSICLLSDSNPFPLLARAHFTSSVRPRLALRFKLGGTGTLIAVVEAQGTLYRATRKVKVTSGGCGG